MKSFAVLAALFVIAIPTAAHAQDEATACSDGYVAVMSAGGPLCVNPTYLDGTWNDDPATCLYGYYQGTCAPEPPTPEPLPVEAYLYQIDTPTPAQIADVETKLVVWLSAVELALADLGAAR